MIISNILKKITGKNIKPENELNNPKIRMNMAEKNLEAIKKIEKQKKVFVLGMSKTGTTSMEKFLEHLGYRVCRGHWNNKDTNFLCACFCYNAYEEILNITNYYDAFADAPWGGTLLYKKLVKLYPDAYYILTVRETTAWSKSFINMYRQFDENMITTMETMRSFGAYGNFLFFKKIFNIENLYNCENKIQQYYDDYNQGVRTFFQNNGFNFLEIDLTDDSFDSRIISNFLGKTTTVKMPHINKGRFN